MKPLRVGAVVVSALLAACSSAGSPLPAGSGSGAPYAHSGSASVLRSATSNIIADVSQAAFRDMGKAPSSNTLTIALTLRYRHQAELDRLVISQSEKGSPLYRHWLSNKQFADEFAPTADDYARVSKSLERAGLRVTHTYQNRTVVDAAGRIDALDCYFRTDIHQVSQSGYGRRYANIRPAYAPADLGSLVLSVDGLMTLTVVKPLYETVKSGVRVSHTRLPDTIGGPLYGPLSSATGLAGYGPLAFANGYDLPVQHKSASGKFYDGTGRASGVVIDADFADTDLAQFLAYFHVKRTGPATTRVPIDGGPTTSATSNDAVEATLDVETIVSLAPGTALYVYEFPNFTSSQYITDAYNQVVSDNLVDTANSSFGEAEGLYGRPTAEAWDAIAEQGAAKGMTFHAASGDSGGGYVIAPASSPHFVAVGGTTLSVTKTGKWLAETGWTGGGGGTSRIFAVRAWQKGVRGVIDTGRNLPDVAFDANPELGEALYYQQSFSTAFNPVGGTSLASPIFGAAITEIDQVQKGRIGLAAQALYTLWAHDGYSNGATVFFHDIVQGSNGAYIANPGYDLVTGIGSIDVWNIAKGL